MPDEHSAAFLTQYAPVLLHKIRAKRISSPVLRQWAGVLWHANYYIGVWEAPLKIAAHLAMLKAQKFQNTGPAPPFICSHSSEDAAKPAQHKAAQLSAHPLEVLESSPEQKSEEVLLRGACQRREKQQAAGSSHDLVL